jgi:GTPase SAR1 family protein
MIQVDEEARILDIMDIHNGQEEFHAMRDIWLRESEVFVFCFSLTNRQSLDDLEFRIEQAMRVKDVDDIKELAVVLVGLKSDLVDQREVSPRDIEEFANRMGIQRQFVLEASAKDEVNVNEVFEQAVRAADAARVVIGRPGPHPTPFWLRFKRSLTNIVPSFPHGVVDGFMDRLSRWRFLG